MWTYLPDLSVLARLNTFLFPASETSTVTPCLASPPLLATLLLTFSRLGPSGGSHSFINICYRDQIRTSRPSLAITTSTPVYAGAQYLLTPVYQHLSDAPSPAIARVIKIPVSLQQRPAGVS